jgi:hypothetical protein
MLVRNLSMIHKAHFSKALIGHTHTKIEKAAALKSNYGEFGKPLQLSGGARSDINWWISNNFQKEYRKGENSPLASTQGWPVSWPVYCQEIP